MRSDVPLMLSRPRGDKGMVNCTIQSDDTSIGRHVYAGTKFIFYYDTLKRIISNSLLEWHAKGYLCVGKENLHKY